MAALSVTFLEYDEMPYILFVYIYSMYTFYTTINQMNDVSLYSNGVAHFSNGADIN